MTAEAAEKLKENEIDIDAREVRGLPNLVHVTKKNSDIIQRIAEKRQERFIFKLFNVDCGCMHIGNFLQ